MSPLRSLRSWAQALRRDALTLWFATRDPAAAWAPRLLCLVIVAYALSPIDPIPDVIPVLGWLDELLLLPALVWLGLRLLPAAVVDAGRRRADDWLAARRERPVCWPGAALVVALWLALAWGALCWIGWL